MALTTVGRYLRDQAEAGIGNAARDLMRANQISMEDFAAITKAVDESLSQALLKVGSSSVVVNTKLLARKPVDEEDDTNDDEESPEEENEETAGDEGAEDETSKKKAKFGGIERSKLKDSDFLFPKERSFPIKTSQDVKDAVHAWGRASDIKKKYSFEQFKSKLMAKARALGFEDAIPDEWKKEKGGYWPNPQPAPESGSRPAVNSIPGRNSAESGSRQPVNPHPDSPRESGSRPAVNPMIPMDEESGSRPAVNPMIPEAEETGSAHVVNQRPQTDTKSSAMRDVLLGYLLQGAKAIYDGKDASDYVWVGLSHNAWIDRQSDIIPLALIEADIKTQKALIQKGKMAQFGYGLWLDHEPVVMGDCKMREVIPGGRSCIEAGNLDPKYKGMGGQQMSVGYWYDLNKDKSYKWVTVYERSALKATRPVNARTFFNVRRREVLSDAAIQKSVDELIAGLEE